MTEDNKPLTEPVRSRLGLGRRTLLKAFGAGTALSLGAGGATASEHGSSAETDDQDDGHFVADVVDPVFGYPLAADETDDLELEHLVELYTVEGSGEHENFPQAPPQEGGDGADGESGESGEGGQGGNGGDGGFQAEFVFDPVGLRVDPGDLVHFHDTAGLHTVTAFHEKYSEAFQEIPTRVPDGVPGFTSPPIIGGESWIYQFSTPGVYDVLCLPHLFFGMVMRVVALDPDEHDVEDDRFAAPSGGELSPNAAAVLTADELAPSNIVDQGTVAWGDLTLEEGGAQSG